MTGLSRWTMMRLLKRNDVEVDLYRNKKWIALASLRRCWPEFYDSLLTTLIASNRHERI